MAALPRRRCRPWCSTCCSYPDCRAPMQPMHWVWPSPTPTPPRCCNACTAPVPCSGASMPCSRQAGCTDTSDPSYVLPSVLCSLPFGPALPGCSHLIEAGRCLAHVVKGHQFPGAFLGQKCAQQLVVHGMARAKCAVCPQDGMANQVQVANCVQDFVLHELIAIAQAIAIEHFVIVHHDGIVQPPTQSQAVGAQHFHIARKAESARARDVAHVIALAPIELETLARRVHCRVGKVDFKAQFETVVRHKAR